MAKESLQPVMHSKTKNRPSDKKSSLNIVEPLMLHGVSNQAALATAASRRMFAAQLASGAANHARHHVSRQTQS